MQKQPSTWQLQLSKKHPFKKEGDNYGLDFHAKNAHNVLKMQKSTFNITNGSCDPHASNSSSLQPKSHPSSFLCSNTTKQPPWWCSFGANDGPVLTALFWPFTSKMKPQGWYESWMIPADLFKSPYPPNIGWVKQHSGPGEAKWSKCLVFPSLVSDICLYRTHKDLLVFFKHICKCSYKAQKLFANILKHGIPTFGFFKCLKLFKFFSHDTCRVSRLKNRQIFTWYKALEGRLYHIRSCNRVCIAWPLFQ